MLFAALGYAEGGRLSREMGGWRVICWALLLSAPFLAVPVSIAITRDGLSAGRDAWLGFAYVAVISMFLGFFAWYAGLAAGGVASVGKIQLVQPVLTVLWSAALLGEEVTLYTFLAALLVLSSVALTQRTRVRREASRK
ncbi:MAG: DMT family transporter [Gemmatimonadetes bacterium]|nr:DMT family transporter [Gemmatimonadota bacterium]